MGKIATKSENVDKLQKIIMDLDSDFFTRRELERRTGFNYDQLNRYLKNLEDFNIVEYSSTMNMYKRVN